MTDQPPKKAGRPSLFPGKETSRLHITVPKELADWYKQQSLGTEAAVLQAHYDRWRAFH